MLKEKGSEEGLVGQLLWRGWRKRWKIYIEEEIHVVELLPENISKSSKHATKQMITYFLKNAC